jgi:hypothetical protein
VLYDMDTIFPLAGAILVLLTVLGVAVKRTRSFLPIGGTHVSQLAVVLGFAFVVYEIMKVFQG